MIFWILAGYILGIIALLFSLYVRKERNQLTEAEIKQDFEWAWQFAKEVE